MDTKCSHMESRIEHSCFSFIFLLPSANFFPRRYLLFFFFETCIKEIFGIHMLRSCIFLRYWYFFNWYVDKIQVFHSSRYSSRFPSKVDSIHSEFSSSCREFFFVFVVTLTCNNCTKATMENKKTDTTYMMVMIRAQSTRIASSWSSRNFWKNRSTSETATRKTNKSTNEVLMWFIQTATEYQKPITKPARCVQYPVAEEFECRSAF